MKVSTGGTETHGKKRIKKKNKTLNAKKAVTAQSGPLHALLVRKDSNSDTGSPIKLHTCHTAGVGWTYLKIT